VAQVGQDFELWQGDHKVLTFTVEDVASLDGATATWAVAYMNAYNQTMIKKAGEINGNVFVVTLTRDDTAALEPGVYYHEAEIIDAAENKSTVAIGQMTLHPTLIRDGEEE